MDDFFDGIDDLLNISDEEIEGVIEGNHPGDMCIPLNVGYLFSLDDCYNMDWMKDFIEGQDKEKTFTDLKDKTEEEQGPENNSDSAISSDLSWDSDNKKNPILCSRVIIPGKPRTKRLRATFCNWASKPISTNGSENSSESSVLISPNDGGLSQSDCLTYEQVEYQSSIKFSAGKGGKKKEVSAGRTCSHCGVSKTPQWRCGPLGPKTLCNACGVRYKSGGLLPEYRPAASPTFSPGKHSNVNKVVLEMRRRKSMMGKE